tara:strand:- start:618 stop:929 length:312 start_codon:yes stop_codon:yes gene_type:complete
MIQHSFYIQVKVNEELIVGSEWQSGVIEGMWPTFINVILVLLTLLSSTSSRVQLIANSTEETTTARGAAGALLILALALLLVLVLALTLLITAGKLVDEVHVD